MPQQVAQPDQVSDGPGTDRAFDFILSLWVSHQASDLSLPLPLLVVHFLDSFEISGYLPD